MNNNNQNQQNDSATTIEEILALFKTLNAPAQEAFMNMFRLSDDIRRGVLNSDMREAMLNLFDVAFDAAAGKGVLT